MRDRAVQLLSAKAKRLGLDGVDIVSFTRVNSYDPAMWREPVSRI